jgi:predicted transcriptional regulator
MVTALETHHGDIQHKILSRTDYTSTEDLFEVIFRPDLVTIASAMTWNVITLDHTKTAYDATNIMKEKRIGSVIVTAYGKPFGIVTEKDLAHMSAFLDVPPKSLIFSYLASRPLICARPTQTIQEAADIMREYDIDHLPILEKDKIVGMIATQDIAMYLLYA